MRIDVLVLGGGAAGLWCLDRLRRAGYHAILLESKALGNGQTIQSQGIIHGGGKYALRGVRDFDAVRATSSMPERWRQSLVGAIEPDLAGTEIISTKCHLWLPRGSVIAWLQSLAFMSFVANAGLLATRPVKVSKAAWPEALRDSALAVYSLAEPVIATGSFLRALAARHKEFIFLYDGAALEFAADGVRVGDVLLQPRAMVLAAGAGNGELLGKAGMNADLMQSRPLAMVLLRGELPPLFGHCIVGGKTGLTITTPVPGIWQIGGEIAERLANEKNLAAARAAALVEIRRWLPRLDLARADIAIYRAVRAEARTAASRRPSGVHANQVAPGMVVAWPTKLSMAPVLADEVCEMLQLDLKTPGGYDETPPWPTPTVARNPWEEAEWFAVN
ncbi:MAG: FAD-dependent oxidoreductase [Deltaproteobacteria bacterium]|nr:FAD-dependent oxidoreductase [Deltaproteobacteria bacterium]